ncbi:putative ABC transporter-binding protein [Fervidicola ferrireducens]|uniref:Putative ABC transporter-binding protein n=1 Tax=Fervidicola ferrireducens TaxID=520764 RepID=A0A140LDG4_9FIRM|nr:sugar ABC transporter substrate-binding protein [Fervidicola ferrireducens]KXG78589.1 putative ABC transporter-binding protein [Fervidicola ferrireducens]
MRLIPFTRFFCFLVTILISLSLTGCEGRHDARRNEEKEVPVVITLWDFPRWKDEKGNSFGWIEKKIAEFEKSHPGVFVHLRKMKWEYGPIELKAAAATGTNPDIAPVAGDIDFILKGYLEPVDEFFTQEELEKYDRRTLDSLSYGGKLYGFPWFITTNALFLNADMFRERNVKIPPDGRWSYQEFVESLQKLTVDKNRDGKPECFGFSALLAAGSYQLWNFLTMDGAKIFDEDGNFALNSPEGISALGKLVDLSAKYKVVPEDFGTSDEKKVWGDFAEKRKIAVYPAGPWAINILKENLKKGNGFNFEIAHYPSGSGKAKPIATVAGYSIFKQEDPKKKALCAEFLKFITSEKEQEALSGYGVFPAIKDLQDKMTKDTFMRRMKEILDDSEILPKIPNFAMVEEIITTQIRQAILGKKTPEQALIDAEAEIKKVREAFAQDFPVDGNSK